MKILIIFATLTGNTEIVAEHISERLKSEGWMSKNVEQYPGKLGPSSLVIELVEAFEVDKNELEAADLILLGASSWGDGDQNPVGEEMVIILEEEPPNLGDSGTRIGYFGLGESHYDNFCGAITKMEEKFTGGYGAEKVGETIKIDGFPDDMTLEKVDLWLQGVLKDLFEEVSI
jgi:flavodoxin